MANVYEFKLPDIGEGVVEGEIVRWLVKEGDSLRMDQPMVEVMTDKATVEIPAPRAGKVAKRLYSEGQLCPVGKVLIAIEETGEETGEGTGEGTGPETHRESANDASPVGRKPQPIATSEPVAAARTSTAPRPAVTSSPTSPVLATPATRKLARDLAVDLARVRGSGPAGRITSEDVRASAEHAPATAETHATELPAFGSLQPEGRAHLAGTRIPFRGVRRKIAERLVRSKQAAPHFTYVEEVDVTQLVTLRAEAQARVAREGGSKLSYLPFFVKAVVAGLKAFPQLNATLDEAAGEIVQRSEYHIGIASATEDGLIVPVVRNADRLSLVEIAREIERLAAATKTGKASRDDLTGSTFTITSLGAFGGLLATPIINYPECAILGVHKISKRPVVWQDAVAIRDMMNLSISVDHRLVDGLDAARFVAMVKNLLETPGELGA